MKIAFRILLVCLPIGLSLSSVAVAQPAAQPAPSTAQPKEDRETDALTAKARTLFEQGKKEFEASRWADAHASLLAAWALKKHWQIAASLGDCEMKLGRYTEAAEHYAYYQREAPPDRNEKAKALFDKARAMIGEVKVHVGIRASSEVLLDGVLIGTTPLREPVFVMPGKHTFQLKQEQYVIASKSIDTAAGGSYEVVLMSEEEHKDMMARLELDPPSDTSQPASAQPQPPKQDPKLPVRKIIIGTGIGTSAVLLGTGIAFAVVSNNKAADRIAQLDALEKESGPSPCYGPSPNVPKCAGLITLRDDRDRTANVAFWTLLAGGLAGAGTLVYALIPPKGHKRTAVQVFAIPTPDGAGFAVRGLW